jgi:hypothetical protein
MRVILLLIILGVIIQDTYACCCSRVGQPKGCEQYDDWNTCIQKPCDWIGTLKPPCEDACWEYRMKDQKNAQTNDKPKKTKKKKKKAAKEDL